MAAGNGIACDVSQGSVSRGPAGSDDGCSVLHSYSIGSAPFVLRVKNKAAPVSGPGLLRADPSGQSRTRPMNAKSNLGSRLVLAPFADRSRSESRPGHRKYQVVSDGATRTPT